MHKTSQAICKFYKSSRGCKFGTNCRFLHSFSPDILTEDQNQDGILKREIPTASSTLSTENLFESKVEKDNHEAVREISNQQVHPNKVRLCHYFAKYGNCQYDTRCKFLHAKNCHQDEPEKRGKSDDVASGIEAQKEERKTTLKAKPNKKKERNEKPVCHFYQKGNCKKGNYCKFKHNDELLEEVVQKSLQIDDNVASSSETSTVLENKAVSQRHERKPFVPVNVVRELKREEATEEEIISLRSVEIQQLKKRFPADKLETLPRVDEKDLFDLKFSSSDPDWPYDVKVFELEISFPAKYPLQRLEITLPEEQNLPETVRRYVEVTIQEWIEEREQQDIKRGVIAMVFRPFLRWLDKNLEDIVTEGLKQLQRELMAKAAGLEFIPASQLKKECQQNTQPEEAEDVEGSTDETGSDSDSEPREFFVYRKDLKEEEEYTGPAEIFSSEDEYEEDYAEDQTLTKDKTLDITETEARGTEIRLRNLQLREAASTMVVMQIKIMIQCTRCHNRMDLKLKPGQVTSVACQKCNQTQLINFRPTMAHQFSSVIGYVDVEGCTPFDLLMQDCNFRLGCMRCSKEINVQGLPPGRLLDVSCKDCYQKLKVGADSTRFTEISPSFFDQSNMVNVPTMKVRKIPKDPRIMLGSPLPDDGTCKHYRKSFRWFRFPCCGKCYPCDVCHEEKEDHELVMANRMICGHCCKEQPFAMEKPCVACHQLMTKTRSSHWEGGKGCRDKTRMSRDDVKKYANTNKTVSRKAQAKVKPSKKKEANK